MTLIEQLNEIYYKHEDWHEKRLDRIELTRWHEQRLANGELITVSHGELLVGYCEFFLAHGVCYVNNLFVLPDYRGSRAIRQIRKRLFEVTKAKIFFGDRQRRKKTEVQLRSNHGI